MLVVVLLAVAFLIAITSSTLNVYQMNQGNWGFLRGPKNISWVWKLTRAGFARETGFLIGPSVLVLAMPLTFAMIPATLRGARVLPGHIARIGLFSLVGPIVLYLCHVVVTMSANLLGEDWFSQFISPWRWRWTTNWHATWINMLLGGLSCTVGAMLWSWWWWSCACRDYLRLGQSRRTVAVLLGIALLAAVNAQAWHIVAAYFP